MLFNPNLELTTDFKELWQEFSNNVELLENLDEVPIRVDTDSLQHNIVNMLLIKPLQSLGRSLISHKLLVCFKNVFQV
jgi:hypothetical protein